MTEANKTHIIGRAEKVYLVDFLKAPITAKVDTGADVSSVWASKIQEKEDVLSFCLFGPSSPHYTGETLIFKKGEYSLTRVANSFGQKEVRYVVKLRMKLDGRVIKATFTLSNRSSKTYPILLGRKLLKGKFVVDVKKGQPLRKTENAKKAKMRLALNERSGKLGA